MFFCCRAGEKKTKKQITESQCGTSVGVVRCPKKKSLPVFFFFCFLPSTTFPPLSFLDTDKPKCFLASGLKICWSVCNFRQKKKINKKLSFSSTVLLSPSAAPPLPHSLPRSGTCTDGERNSHFSSALLRFFESRRMSARDVETLPLSSSHGEIHDTVTSRQSN